MVCKNRGVYRFLSPSWVLITMPPRNSIGRSRRHLVVVVVVVRRLLGRDVGARAGNSLGRFGGVCTWNKIWLSLYFFSKSLG